MTTQPAAHGDAFVHPENFVECLRQLTRARPDDTALTVVAERGGEVVDTVLSYREFGLRVHALAALLQRRFKKGERVLILLDNDEHYAVSMFACFHSGVIAVPVFPPASARPQHLARLAGIASDAQARGILTIAPLQDVVRAAASQFGVEEVLAVDGVDVAQAGDWRVHRPARGDVAFLQYTSGSTSTPKGVMVTHGNLMANEKAIREGLSIGADDRFGVWSPLFHDMGLIGGLLQPFYSGIPCVLSSPRFFLERPVRWLEMISRHRVTISGGPDFAYRLCVERIDDEQMQGLDLSSWRLAYTGAEPVRHDTMEAFVARYADVGLNAGAVYPCYGLAEATLFVTGAARGRGMVVRRFDGEALARRRVAPDELGDALVGCGTVPGGHEVRIADPRTGEPAQADAIGEIWAAGPSMAAGYWNRLKETEEAFVERDGRRWLRTGDLGFVHDGQLFVAGRLKDMIIVRGHNIYPQDAERAVEAEVEAVRKGRVAAFAVKGDGDEGIGIAAEVSQGMQKLVPAQALADAVSAAVSEQCGEAPRVVVLLHPGALPKTSSGKLQRSACRQGWETRSLDAYALFENGRAIGGDGQASPGVAARVLDEVQAEVAAIWREVLGHDAARDYGRDTHFLALGGNSLAAVQVASRIAGRWSVAFPPRLVFEHPRLHEQAGAVRAAQAAGAAAKANGIITALPQARRAQPLPLSSAQKRQWFLWQFDPHGNAYHVQGALRIAGPLDARAMQDAVAMLAGRHDALRTVFQPLADGDVGQVVQPHALPAWRIVDLRESAAVEREVQAEAALRALSAEPFDLVRGPLTRVALIRLADEEHMLALVMHHIVSDGASMQILVDDLGALYAARVAGREQAALAPCRIQYADFAAWQDGEGARADEGELAYWRERLAVDDDGPQPVLALPTDRPRPAVARYQAARHCFDIPADVLAGLRHQAARQGATLFMTLLAAFQAVLYRCTGQRDIRVGVPVANRDRPEVQGVVGLFVNTLVLRNAIDGRMSLSRLLRQTAEAALGAMAHQDLPFERLVEALQPQRSLSHSPLFQVMFNHLRQDHATFARVTGLAVQPVSLLEQEAQFELSLRSQEHADGRVRMELVYAAELFDAATIARMAGHCQAMLKALAEQPGQAVGDVVLPSEAEQAQLARWAAGEPSHAEPEPVHRLIERQAMRTPDAPAVLCGTRSLSHLELNAQANRLAHRLIACGVGPETRVGVAIERSAEMVIALLAVLKAGGAYVPLDPAYPSARLAHMVTDSGIGLLITQSGPGAGMPMDGTVRIVSLDALDLSGEPAHDPQVAVHAGNLAYVIYTSGSTGRPKGVAVPHGALSMHLQAVRGLYGLTPSDRLLQFASISFDAAAEQWMLPLLAGAAMVLPESRHMGLGDLADMVRRHGVTVLYMPPAYLRQLTQALPDGAVPVRLCIAGGEAWAREELAQVRRVCEPRRLINAYGPAETVITPTAWSDDAGLGEATTCVPVGRPVGQRQAWVLDADLNLLPPGMVGELYLGGAGVARGYLDRAGLTADRFVADPFCTQGGRLYRTGDLARWGADGQLEYLGRIDHQVKLRGMRVEPGEIEACLAAQPMVREAVVLAKDGPAGTRLVAYVAAADGQAIDVARLKEALGADLPDYMVPASIVVLDALPLTPNGKVDRRALPEPEALARATAYEAPQGEVEQALAAIWSEVLGIDRIGMQDNFFDLGGHSLLLLRVHRLLAERMGVGLSVVDLFKYPAICALARRITQGAGDGQQGASPVDGADQGARRRAALMQRKRQAERAG